MQRWLAGARDEMQRLRAELSAIDAKLDRAEADAHGLRARLHRGPDGHDTRADRP